MEPVLYRMMNGSQIDFNRQNTIAHNLANANTPGFRADLHQAATQYFQNNSNPGMASSYEKPNGIDFSDGDLMTTGRDLDLALQGEAWFAVQDSEGQEAYTRSGAFKLTENGVLVTGTGQQVLGDGGPISIPPAEKINIGKDGTISIVPLGGDPNTLAVLDRIRLVKLDKANAYKGSDGLVRLQNGAKGIPDSNLTVINGALEGSNVKPFDQMVNMINAGRQFDTHMKIMQTVDENFNRLAQLLHE